MQDAWQQPELVRAGGSFLTLTWRAAHQGLEAEYRRSSWLSSATWVPCPLHEGLSGSSGTASDGEALEVTLGGLKPLTVYDVRLSALHADGSRHFSPVVTFSTLELAPKITSAPELKCARHDRLLLRWSDPTAQVDEVLAYRVRYSDCEPLWPRKHEVEVKIASRLLRRSEQMRQFLSGLVALRSVRLSGATAGGCSSESDTEEAEGADVHFWLLDLVPARVYCVQVAAITAGGLGQWSPKSSPLRTWRVAPTLKQPQQVFHTHASIAVGLALEPLAFDTTGQDEEVESFEVIMHPVRDVSQVRTITVSREEAVQLSTRLVSQLDREPATPCKCVASFMLAASGLSPMTAYSCKARAITHAGIGQYSAASTMETLAVPPEVCELRVDATLHDRATLSWSVLERCASAATVQAYLGEEAELELQARRLRGFKVRVADKTLKNWHEVVGVRAQPLVETGARMTYVLGDLLPSSHYCVQLAAVSSGQGDGEWSEVVEINTEALAPTVAPPVVHVVTRCWAVLQWPTPEDLTAAPVLSYSVIICKKGGRKQPQHQHDVPLMGGGGECAGPPEDRSHLCIWQDGKETRLSLGLLEPDTPYCVHVAAQTVRGLGSFAVGSVQTLPCAPAMAPQVAPQLVRAYHDRMVLVCEGPETDWREEDGSDVLGYRARYYECGSGGRVFASTRLEVDVESRAVNDGKAIEFTLLGLACEREYVVQVAAVTAFGRGSWSAESPRMSTWRLAPLVQRPRVLLRTHTALVLGWSLHPVSHGEHDVGQDEEILDFAVHTRVHGSIAPKEDVEKSIQLSRRQADELAQVLKSPTALVRQLRAKSEDSAALAVLGDVIGTSAASEEEPSFGDAMLCEDFAEPPEFAAVVRGLDPDRMFVCTVAAVTQAGVGHASPASAPRATLAIAPEIEQLEVDEVQKDRIQVSWELPRTQPPISPETCERLGLSDSMAELEIMGFDVRCAAWTTWTRLHWREPVHLEVARLQRDDAGRAFVIVEGLDAERHYIVELRARSGRGAGAWCRVDEQPICTAIDVPAPPAPELVKNTPHALTFSFAGAEDKRIVAYEVRRFEGWMRGWGRALKPLRFDASWPSVRVTSERRWVVTIEELRSETTHALQLRGVTQSGGITKWSEWSEAMSTLRESDCPDVDIGAAMLKQMQTGSSSPSLPVPLSSGGGAPSGKIAEVCNEPLEDLARKLEAILAFTVDYATAGVRLPSVTVLSITEMAAALLQEQKGSLTRAIDAAAKIEEDALWRTKLPDFLIHQAPVAGCSMLLLREIWRNSRRCALIAHFYGHNVRNAETQALLLACLVPQGCDAPVGSPVLDNVAAETGSLTEGTKAVGLLLREYASVGSPGKICTSAPAAQVMVSSAEVDMTDGQQEAVVGTNASTGLSETAAEDTGPPNPTRVAHALFRPPKAEEHPATILGLFALWLLPLFVSATRFAFQSLLPLLVQRVRMDLSLAGIVVLLMIAQVVGVALVIWVQENIDTMVSFPATFVFVVYAAAPGASIWLATRSTLKSLTVAPCFALLGLYSLATGYLRWADDLLDDYTLEGRAVPWLVWGRRRQRFALRAHRILWALLLLDFVAEEFLGRWCGLHSWRLLGPPLAEEAATPAEYQSPAFALFLAAAGGHQRVLALTKRHTVLVRMLGARRAQLPELRLFLMGANEVVANPAATLEFLRRVSPLPRWCCLALFLRRWGAAGGVLIPLSLYVLRDPNYLGALPKESLVPIAVALGALLGQSATSSFAALWQECQEHIEAEYRVLYLFPHMNAKARSKAADALCLPFERNLEAEAPVGTTGWAALSLARQAGRLFLPGGPHAQPQAGGLRGGLRRRSASKSGAGASGRL